MVECERPDLVCLHLDAHDDARTRSPAPQTVTAVGIGDALELGETTVDRVRLLDDLATLEDEGLVTSEERTIEGRDAPRTAYFLTDDAREQLQAALEGFEEAGAPGDALETLEHLVEVCRRAGDDEAARAWYRRAEDVLANAPDPVAERHRSWVADHADDPADR